MNYIIFAEKLKQINMARQKKEAEDSNAQSLKSLTKSSVWDVQENDIFRMIESGVKDAEIRENIRHYTDIIRCAFEIIELKEITPQIKKVYNKKGYKIAEIKAEEELTLFWAIKKKPILRVTDLSYENICHISAAKLIEVLDRNFGGGWDSLTQSIQDIILSGFDISTTTLPKDRLHKKGGLYDKKLSDGYEVLEVPKGNWVEAIFAKTKPQQEKVRMQFDNDEDDITTEDEDDDADVIVKDDYKNHDDDDMIVEDPDDDEITEENYSTMMDLGSSEDDEDAAQLIDFVDE